MARKKKGVASDSCIQMSLVEAQRARNVFSNPQTEILLNTIDNMARGIFLVPPPTGIGKSHAVTHAFIQTWLEGKRLWFITARKNNLKEPIANLLREAQHLNETGKLSDSDLSDLMKAVIPLHNYIEAWAAILDRKGIPAEVRKSKLYKSKDFQALLKNLGYAYKKLVKNPFKDEADRYKENFYDAERAVRIFVKDDFREFAAGFREGGSKRVDGAYAQDVVDAYVELNPWVTIVYPYININKCYNGRCPIVFATEAKKNSPCDNLMGDTSCLYAQIRKKGGIAIIDEIDQSKVACRDNLLKANVYNKFKIADLIKKNFTDDRLEIIINTERDPASREKMKERLATSSKIIADFESRFGPITTLREFSDACKESMGSRIHIIMETSFRRYVSDYMTYGCKGAAAYIDIVEKKPGLKHSDKDTASDELPDDVVWLHDAANGVTGIINHFVASLPYFLETLKIKRGHALDSTYDYANIASLLHALNIEAGTDEFDYLIDRMVSRGSIVIQKMPVINSLYSRGISVSIPSLSEYDSERNTIDSFSIDISPEEILATMADAVLVIGLSATADIDSAIGNYNYEWIKSCNIPVCALSDSDWETIGGIQRGRFANIDAVSLHIDEITAPLAKEGLTPECLLEISDIASMSVNEDTDPSFEIARLSKLVVAFGVFCFKDFVAGIALTQRDYGKAPAIENAFKRLFAKFDPNVEVFFANSDKMEDLWSEAKSCLANGRRIFFIAPYQSGNTGLNYNYPLSREYWEYCHVADQLRTYSEKIDVDFMYLSGITNVFPRQDWRKGFDRTILAKQLCIIEEMYLRGEISEEKRAAYIMLCMDKGTIGLDDQMSWPSYQGEVLKILVQSLGRFERSPYKRSSVGVLYDSDLSERVDADYIKSYLMRKPYLNPHTKAVLESLANNASSKGSTEDRKDIRYSNCATDTLSYLNREYKIRRGNLWYPEKICRYELLRRFVIEHPTATESDFAGNEWMKDLYLKKDGDFFYSFHYAGVQIRRSPMRGFRKLSSDASNLDDLLKNPLIHDHFVKNGYAVSWKDENEYIMSPGLMVNIYMGVVGEEALKALLAGTVIESITNIDIYELFDFICNRVPVDAKNYTPEAYPGGRAPDEYVPKKQLEIIAYKLDKANAEAAVYVNLIDDGKRKDGEVRPISGGLLKEKKEWNRPVLIIHGLVGRDGTVNKREMHRLLQFIEDHADAISDYREA